MSIRRLRKFPPFVGALRLANGIVPAVMLLGFIVLGLIAPSVAQPACPPNGDVDQNGSVTAADALLAFQQTLGLAQLSACQRTIADVSPEPADPDGSITASDALCIFQNALGLPSCLDTLPPPNQPPIADAGPDQSADAGVVVFLSGTASDPDGAIASHAWTQTGGTSVPLTGVDAATAVFVAPDVSVDETLTFLLTVTDDDGAQASDEVRVTVYAVMAPPDQASADQVFRQHISGPVVQTKCINCHVANGASGHTRLVFVRSTDTPDHEAQNLQTFENFLAAAADEGGGSYVLNKIQGVGHGGGVQVSPGTEEFANMQRFLSLLGEQVAPSAPVTVETLFDTVIMASPRKTLRRAALIFAGRIPTDEEYAAVEAGDESVLRATIRGLMEGPQFHEFLIRASNDRLLTDRDSTVIDGAATDNFVDLSNLYHQKAVAVSQGHLSKWEFSTWEHRVQYGFRRSPLELIAYVVQHDLPYTEILTADYIMANPMAAEAYGASTRFADRDDPFEFRPSEIVSYYRDHESKISEYTLQFGTKVTDPGFLSTIYPHAGILNTTVFLRRYPTTATNRNRARARWTYYHFLGLDVEKSASRTTNPVALADNNNPTMHNPNCTVCHSLLDPVAGAFQNYGDEGFYRDQWGGMDSLDGFYKRAPQGGQDVTVDAFSWKDRRALSVTGSLPGGESAVGLQVILPRDVDHSEWTPHLGIDFLAIRRLDGSLVQRYELEEVFADRDEWPWNKEYCGHTLSSSSSQNDDRDSYRLWECPLSVPVEVPENGDYSVEVAAWVLTYGGRSPEAPATLRIWVPAHFYEKGDTWYRGMRNPGFAGLVAPDADTSLRWLAQQIISDKRFAEATAKFWWPAIMGSEIAEFPEDAEGAEFEGLLLAANAQNAEMVRLAEGFRHGFQGSPYTYNLKDLLVEIVLSKWFRADALTEGDPVRRVALRDAGARRLLTPEELARKTDAITGVQWGRELSPRQLLIGGSSALTGDYGLLYGGIDSDGITERARDVTSVMAGVAKRHAAEVSCPVIMRELYLLPDADRRLFAGIETEVTPVSEFSGTFEIAAASRSEMETLSLKGHLTAGLKTVSLAFLNEYYESREEDRDVLLDRLTVRQGNRVVHQYEIENLHHPNACHHIEQDAFHLSISGPECRLAVPVAIPTDGVYRIDISAWGDQAGDELPRLLVAVQSDAEDSAGSRTIRNKLVELYDKLLGVQATPESADVEAAYRLFVDVWERRRQSQEDWFRHWHCRFGRDLLYFEGVLDGAAAEYENQHGHWWYNFDYDRISEFLDGIDFSDHGYTAQTWVVVLAAMMMDYRYLYL